MKDKTIWTRMHEKEFISGIIYNRHSDVFIWYMVDNCRSIGRASLAQLFKIKLD